MQIMSRHLGDFARLFGIDQRANMQAARAGMRVVGHLVPICDRIFNLRDIFCQMLDRHGGILDKGHRLVIALDAHQQPQANFSHRPDIALTGRFQHRNDFGCTGLLLLQMLLQPFNASQSSASDLAVELGNQHAVRFALDKVIEQAGIFGHVAAHASGPDYPAVQPPTDRLPALSGQPPGQSTVRQNGSQPGRS